MSRDDQSVSTPTIILIVAVLLGGLLGAFVIYQHHAAVQPPAAEHTRPALNADQQAYLGSLEFSDLRVSAATNYLGDTVTYLDGAVANKGSKSVRRLDVELNFVDTLNQVVLRETAHPLADLNTPLGPGQSHEFRVTFEHMPAEWNQSPPTVKTAYVEF